VQYYALSNKKDIQVMDVPNFDKIENQVLELMERYKSVKASREEFALRINELEKELAEMKSENQQLQSFLDEAKQNTRDFEKEDRIKTRVDELLEKLEGI